MTALEAQAYKFAWFRHGKQFRKYTGEPYINHPIRVAELVKTVAHTNNMIAAALLHDVVEDTSATLEDIKNNFNLEVAELVRMLTNISHADDGLRRHRKAKDKEHLSKASHDAKTIKLADIIDNCSDIRKLDAKFAKIYLAEKADLLNVLEEGDPILFGIAYNIIHKGE
jgi:(p)ppGpp synthase/HD superfamily hydrolase